MTKSVLPKATPVASSNLLAKADAGAVHAVNVVAGASAGFVLLLDAAAMPVNGAVTPIKAYPLAANALLDLRFAVPLQVRKGLVVAFSTTGPFTLTASATAFISADVE